MSTPESTATDPVAALTAAAAQDAQAQQTALGTELPQPIEDASAPGEGEAQQGEATTPADAVESFTTLDPAQLPDELQPVYRNMNRHFTQRLQEVAEWRKIGQELGVDPATARQAIQFAGQLQSDPEYARQVYDALSQAYGFQAAASNGATGAPPAQGQDFPSFPEDDEEAPAPARQGQQAYGDIPDDHPLAQRLAQLEQRLSQQDETQWLTSFTQQIKQQELAVRDAHPTWDDGDIGRLYELAPSHDGDLLKAAEAYAAWQDDVLTKYVTRKTQDGGASAPPRGGQGTIPTERAKTTKEASDRAMESLSQVIGAS